MRVRENGLGLISYQDSCFSKAIPRHHEVQEKLFFHVCLQGFFPCHFSKKKQRPLAPGLATQTNKQTTLAFPFLPPPSRRLKNPAALLYRRRRGHSGNGRTFFGSKKTFFSPARLFSFHFIPKQEVTFSSSFFSSFSLKFIILSRGRRICTHTKKMPPSYDKSNSGKKAFKSKKTSFFGETQYTSSQNSLTLRTKVFGFKSMFPAICKPVAAVVRKMQMRSAGFSCEKKGEAGFMLFTPEPFKNYHMAKREI